MDRKLLLWCLSLLAVVGIGVAAYELALEWSAAPALVLDATELDLGEIALGQTTAVEFELRNSSGQDLRVVGEQTC